MSTPTVYLPTLKSLVQCYQAFEACSGADIRALGLTPPKFDIVATLGNTSGMTATELGEKTLITKGTLTGVVDRLVERGWVERVRSPQDRRAMLIHLTPAGQQLVRRAEKIAATMERGTLAVLSPAERALLVELLLKVGLRAPARRRAVRTETAVSG